MREGHTHKVNERTDGRDGGQSEWSSVRCCAVCVTVLCCAVLCCAVRCCAVLCCAVLCCAVRCAVLWGIELRSRVEQSSIGNGIRTERRLQVLCAVPKERLRRTQEEGRWRCFMGSHHRNRCVLSLPRSLSCSHYCHRHRHRQLTSPSAVWCGVVWCGVVCCGVVWCGVCCAVLCWVWCGVVWCGVVWCGVCCAVLCCAGCGVVWCGVVCGVRRRGACPQVHSVAWNCTGQKLASGSLDKTARIWSIDPVSGKSAVLSRLFLTSLSLSHLSLHLSRSPVYLIHLSLLSI